MKGCLGLFLALSFIFVVVLGADDIINKNVDRVISLKTQLVRHTVNIEIQNEGQSSVSSYNIAIQDKYVKHLGFIQAKQGDTHLTISKPTTEEGCNLYSVNLSKNLDAKETASLEVVLIFSHSQHALPTHILQDQKQFVRYNDNLYFFSPYRTKSQKTVVKLASQAIESNTKKSPTNVKGDTITYGPYSDIKPRSHHDLDVHFESNAPFITITKLVKEYELSFWGSNIAIEEESQLQHDGAIHKGPFSRINYLRALQSRTPVPSVRMITEILHPQASDVYYRDEIGNISTSHASKTKSGVKLEIMPRFPLFGGWKTAHLIGYNQPLASAVSTDYNNPSLYIFNTTLVPDFRVDDIVIDQLVIRVILPEGASNPKIHSEVPFTDLTTDAVRKTYLDSIGRPIVEFEYHNVLPAFSAKYVQVTFTFSSSSLLREPILLFTFFLAFFGFFIVIFHTDFTIGKPISTAISLEKAVKIQHVIADAKAVVEQRSERHEELEQLVQKFIKNKISEKQFVADKKNIENSFATLSRSFTKALSDLKELDNDLATRLAEIEKLELKKTNLQNTIHENDIKQKGKSASPGQEEQKYETVKTIEITDEEIEQIISDLLD